MRRYSDGQVVNELLIAGSMERAIKMLGNDDRLVEIRVRLLEKEGRESQVKEPA